MNKILFIASLLILPISAGAASLQQLLGGILYFIGFTLVPFLIGIAFLFFVINVFRYFILAGGNKDVRETAKGVAIYSVGALVFLVIFWGLVNALSDASGLEGRGAVTPDYIRR